MPTTLEFGSDPAKASNFRGPRIARESSFDPPCLVKTGQVRSWDRRALVTSNGRRGNEHTWAFKDLSLSFIPQLTSMPIPLILLLGKLTPCPRDPSSWYRPGTRVSIARTSCSSASGRAPSLMPQQPGQHRSPATKHCGWGRSQAVLQAVGSRMVRQALSGGVEPRQLRLTPKAPNEVNSFEYIYIWFYINLYNSNSNISPLDPGAGASLQLRRAAQSGSRAERRRWFSWALLSKTRTLMRTLSRQRLAPRRPQRSIQGLGLYFLILQ